MKHFRQNLTDFLLACLVGLLTGSLVQTQFNLVFLQELGADIDWALRIQTTFADLGNFAPTYAVLFMPAFLLSQPVAAFLSRFTASWARLPLAFSAGCAGLWVAFKTVDLVAPMPEFLAVTRPVSGLLSMLATAGLAGALYAHLRLKRRQADRSMQVLSSLARTGLVGATALGLTAGFQPTSQAASADYQVNTLAEGFNQPWSLAFLPSGDMLVTEKPGRLSRVPAGGGQVQAIDGGPEVFYRGQGGLFEVLPSPDFADSGKLFLSYACGTSSANHTCVATGQLNGRSLTGVQEIFRTAQPKEGGAHFGGRMAFMNDGSLILTLGDGYTLREKAQTLDNHFGKIVRIMPDGSAPKDNPFTGQNGSLDTIYSFGHRNVQGLVYDSDSNTLIAHEHGAKGGDEINLIKPGINYGWPLATWGVDYSGAKITPFTEYKGTQQPALYWTPSIAPSGMTLYKGDLFPQWKGNLLVGALKYRQVKRVELGPDGKAREVESLFEEIGERIRDVRTGPDGAVYLLTDSSQGKLIRISPK